MSTRLGASRMSSVFGLNAKPQSAKVRPATLPPKCARMRRNSTCFWSAFTACTASIKREGAPTCEAVRCSACTSLGKHEPP